MTENLQLPSFQVQAPGDWEIQGNPGSRASAGTEKSALHSGPGHPSALSSSTTPSLRRKRFKMRHMKNVQSESGLTSAAPAGVRSEVLTKGHGSHSFSGAMECLQLPSIEITPSSDEDTVANWSNCSTPSASPRRKRFLLRRWLNVREKKEHSSDSSRENSLHSSHEEEPAHFLKPHSLEERIKQGCHLRVTSLRRRLAFHRVM
ncbi:hypothetical protein DPEC_G00222430 [Dallia pectoralis]|uniref:Uncharacterized protein n=1 Tax=Dallia pectoralis TaxID=75939 RepID=A0ACC2FZH0_DALPE|nr:hypothetical protein DPEC_G00222430 [Dallia pectoralis]